MTHGYGGHLPKIERVERSKAGCSDKEPKP